MIRRVAIVAALVLAVLASAGAASAASLPAAKRHCFMSGYNGWHVMAASERAANGGCTGEWVKVRKGTWCKLFAHDYGRKSGKCP